MAKAKASMKGSGASRTAERRRRRVRRLMAVQGRNVLQALDDYDHERARVFSEKEPRIRLHVPRDTTIQVHWVSADGRLSPVTTVTAPVLTKPKKRNAK